MFFKVQDHLKEYPNILPSINCPIEIPIEPEPIPEIDYWVKF